VGGRKSGADDDRAWVGISRTLAATRGSQRACATSDRPSDLTRGAGAFMHESYIT